MSKNRPFSFVTLFRSYYILGILSIIWGLAFVGIKALEPLLWPVNLTLLRWFLASAAFLIVAPFLGRMKTRFDLHDLPRFLIVAFSNVVAYTLTLNFSESTITAGLAVLLVSLGPAFIVVLSIIFLKERHGFAALIAILLAFTGAVILSLGSELTSGKNLDVGILESVGTAFSYAVFAVFSKPLVQKYGPKPLTIWTGLAGTVMLLPLLSVSFISQVDSLPLFGWLAILYLSVLSTVIGYMLFYTLVSRGSVGRLSLQLYLIPVVAVFGGVILLGEPLTVYTVLGGSAILASVGFSTRQPKRPVQVIPQNSE